VRRILVGLDASPRATVVLQAAATLARALGGELVIYRAVGIPVEIPHAAYALPPDSVSDLLQNQAREQLQAFVAELAPGIASKVRVDVGTSWRSICAAAHEERADLIIIGSHGYSGLDRVMGTTAAKVVNHADCSVLVVRDPIAANDRPTPG
jgi:universal stress protein F